jgi:hypothetical protein
VRLLERDPVVRRRIEDHGSDGSTRTDT